MPKTTPDQNKALVLEAFDTLFNKRDYALPNASGQTTTFSTARTLRPGRDGLFNLIRTLPDTLRYENQLIVAEGDYVIAHGRFGKRTARWAPKISDRGAIHS